MGINRNGLELLIHSKKYVDFENTITIGRQSVFVEKKELSEILPNLTSDKSRLDLSDVLFKELGAKTIDSVDYSDYEGATIIHDMNKPVEETLTRKYSVVFDGGSLEHIFNVPVALLNCMNLLKVGGHFISITPTNNFVGHGFYQFSPELFYSVFNEKYGFQIKKMIFFIDSKYTNYYEVADPQKVKDRVILSNNYPSYLFVIAEKISESYKNSFDPQQSDYQNQKWETKGDESARVKNNYLRRKLLIIGSILRMFHPLGVSSRKYFKKTKLQ